MPQLDKVTFLSQFFWLSFFYIAFYFLILKHFLPKMSRILKFRKKKMSGSQKGAGSLTSENQRVQSHFDGMVTKSLHTSRSLFADTFQRTEKWLESVRHDTDMTHYKRINKRYILSVGRNSLTDNLPLSQSSPKVLEQIFTRLLLSRLR